MKIPDSAEERSHNEELERDPKDREVSRGSFEITALVRISHKHAIGVKLHIYQNIVLRGTQEDFCSLPGYGISEQYYKGNLYRFAKFWF